ncbi:MAG: biosynthetic peptidoglycan transglycosylase [Bacteroidia bacterium]
MRIIKKIILIFFVALLAGVAGIYLLRQRIVNYYYFKKINSIEQRYAIKIVSDSLRINNLSTAQLNYIYIIPKGNDTLFTAQNLNVSIDVNSLVLSRKISVKNIVLSNLAVNMVTNGKQSNYSFLTDKKTNDSTSASTAYNVRIANYIDKLFDILPTTMQAQHLQVNYTHPTLKLGYTMDTLKINNGTIVGVLNEDFSGNTWSVNGKIDKYNKRGNVALTSYANNADVYIIEKLTHVKCNFKKAEIALNNSTTSDQLTTLDVALGVTDLSVAHYRLSTTPILVQHATTNAQLSITPTSLGIDSTSIATVNGLVFKPYARITMRPVKQYELGVNVPVTTANNFIHALPQAMFSNFGGMQCSGNLGYRMQFKLNAALPDSCTFDSRMIAQDVKITKMGVTDFSKINGAFAHAIYEKEVFMRSIIIGASNPNFYNLESISPYVQQAIMTSEDGSFMWHKGFNEGAFRKSIAQNYKERRFARGGSTISMQLVKNVFLSRNKTVSRKAEEALIVWCIENLHISNKKRMYEVYMNSIEFGPNVYGIGEASQFYFAKKPSALSLNESIFLSCIVPKPKAFMYYFDAQGKLNTYLEPHFQFIARILHHKGVITENEMNDVHANVTIVGNAKRYLKHSSDTLTAPRSFDELWKSLENK